MNHRGIINFNDFVDEAMRGIRFSSKSHHRLIDGFDLPPQDYYNWGPVPELSQENREMYIRDAKIALTYFTTQGIIKEWYEDVHGGNQINTMSWETPLSIIYQTTSRHHVQTEVSSFYIIENSSRHLHLSRFIPNNLYLFRSMIFKLMRLLIQRWVSTRFVIFYYRIGIYHGFLGNNLHFLDFY